MQDITFIRQFPELFDDLMKRRNLLPIANKILELDSKRRDILTALQNLQKQRNEVTREIEILKKSALDASARIKQSQNIAFEIEKISSVLRQDNELESLLMKLPNILQEKVPNGKNSDDNIEIKRNGNPVQFAYKIKSHYDLGVNLKLMDFQKASDISGSRFVILKGQLASLDRALASFMLDIHTKEFEYLEVLHPILVKESAMYGVGQLPKFSEDSFKTTDDLRLIPTSEVVLTNFVMNEIVNQKDLPIRLTSYSQCFRSEAGSAGQDTRGMIRHHQFSKVELVSITDEHQSSQELDRMIYIVEEVLKRLELPYRIMLLCSGDTGFSSSLTYDFEVWFPYQNQYREISSCSNCKDFQARRMNARYAFFDNKKKNIKYLHTLNGSALAIGRTIAAILENYQNDDESITIPSVLVPYMNGCQKIEKI